MLSLQITLKVIDIFYIHRYGPIAKNQKTGLPWVSHKVIKDQNQILLYDKETQKIRKYFCLFSS